MTKFVKLGENADNSDLHSNHDNHFGFLFILKLLLLKLLLTPAEGWWKSRGRAHYPAFLARTCTQYTLHTT